MSDTLTVLEGVDNALQQITGQCGVSKSVLDFNYDELQKRIQRLRAIVYGATADPLGFLQPGTGAVGRAVVDKLRDLPFDVREYGGVLDGVTDCGPAIQRGHDAGRTMCQINGPAYVGTSCTFTHLFELIGNGWNEAGNTAYGSWIIIDKTTIYPFTWTNINGAGFDSRGSGARDLGVKQVHDAAVAGQPWTPRNYPDVFLAQNTFGMVYFRNLFFFGVNRGIASVNAGRTYVDQIWGQLYTRGIYIDQAYDCPHIGLVHLWVYANTADAVVQYQQANCDAIVMARCDTPFVDSVFSFASRTVLYLTSNSFGHTSKLTAGSIVGDFVKYGILCDAASTADGGVFGSIGRLIAQGESWPSQGIPLPGNRAILISGGNVRLKIKQTHAERMRQNAIEVSGADVRLWLGDFSVDYYDYDNVGAGGIVNTGSGSVVYYDGQPNMRKTGVGTVTDQSQGAVQTLGAGAAAIAPLLNAKAASLTPDYLQASEAVGGSGAVPAISALGPEASVDLALYAKGPNGRLHINTVLSGAAQTGGGQPVPSNCFALMQVVVNGVTVGIPTYQLQ